MIAKLSALSRVSTVAMVCLATVTLFVARLPARAENSKRVASDQQESTPVPATDDGQQSPESAPLPLVAPFDAKQAKAAQEAWAKHLGKSSPVEKNSLGMELVLIPPGSFTMGSPDTETARLLNEKQVDVTLTNAFYIGKTEVTQGQWQAIMGTTPWKDRESFREGANYAVTFTSWKDIQIFCEKLSDQENATYRLASEAEWEFACRAGTKTQYSFGDDHTKLNNYAWWGGILGDGSAANEQFAHEVGLKLANPFGLHDMHGNVWEWCVDSYAPEVPGGTDPFRLEGGLVGVCRGGGWNSYAIRARSAFRFRIVYHHAFLPLGSRYSFVGFRVIRTSI